MKIILLAGGSGKRLYPLSTEETPKPFIKFNFLDNNKTQSLIQRIYDQLLDIYDPIDIYFSINTKHKDILQEQINTNNIIEETLSKNTYPAIANIVFYLKEHNLFDKNIALVPTDANTSKNFYKVLADAENLLITEKQNICLIGICPTYPATQYGYIRHSNNNINYFVEKPSFNDAKDLLNKNCLWNSGIIVADFNYLYNRLAKELNYNNYEDFQKHFESLEKISFDKKILEFEKNMLVVESKELWSDLGSWSEIIKYIDKSKIDKNIVRELEKNDLH